MSAQNVFVRPPSIIGYLQLDFAKLSPSQANPSWAEVSINIRFGRPASRPAWKFFFLLLPELLESWNFAYNPNLTQQAIKWKKKLPASLPELPWLAIFAIFGYISAISSGILMG